MTLLQNWIDFHPFRLFATLLLLGFIAWQLLARAAGSHGRIWLSAMVAACAFAVLAVTLWRLWPYFTSPACGWPLEPQIISVSEMVRRGAPAYPRPEITGLCYAQVYGPATYLTYAAVFQLFGRSIEAAKAASALAALAVLVLMAGLVWRSRHEHRLILLALLAAVFAYFGIYAWGIRPDPWILLSLAVFLAALALPRGVFPLALASLAGGWLLAYKPSGALYLMAPLVWAWQNKGWRWAWACGLLMIPTALWPFLLPQFSLDGYLASLSAPGNFPFLARTLSGPAQTVLMLALLAMSGVSKGKKTWLVTGVYITGLGGTLLVTGRLLAVNHHFVPYYLIGLFLVCMAKKEVMPVAHPSGRNWQGLFRSGIPAALALTLVLPSLLASYSRGARQAYEIEAQLSRSVTADLDKILAAHPDRSSAMALGAGYADGPGSLTPYRSHLVLRGQPYFLDAETFMEIGFQGIDPNQAIQRILQENKNTIWLTPKGQLPFAALSSYSQKPIIDPSITISMIKTQSSFESAYFDLLRVHQ